MALAAIYASAISPGGFFPGPLAPPPPACLVIFLIRILEEYLLRNQEVVRLLV